MSASYTWHLPIKLLHTKACADYAKGNRILDSYFIPEEIRELAAIGATAMEFYDFAEDAESLDWETALLIASARRDYFLVIQKGEWSKKQIVIDDLPAKTDELDGIAWLPRLIAKAEGRLRGELPPDLMYCCGGDRRFFEKYAIHPADFLREVWAADGDAAKILRYVRSRR